MSGKVVLVCGDRRWTDDVAIHAELMLLRDHGFTSVIHGAARGADRIAGQEARLLGFAVKEFPASWDVYGKAAGVFRNEEMVHCLPDLVLAFHANLKHSRGTSHMVQLARGYGIPVRVITAGNPELTLAFFAKKVSKETLYEGGAPCRY